MGLNGARSGQSRFHAVSTVISGGKGSLAGPVVGGLIFGLLPVALRPVMAPEAQWIAYGGVLIAILFVLPRGIVPSLAQRFAPRRSGTAALAPVALAETGAKEPA